MRKTCALTGHRELPSDFDKNKLYDTLEQLIKDGYDRFLCGMAAGFDLLSLSCLVDLKKKYPITLVACIPFAGQEKIFSPEDKTTYWELLSDCDEKETMFDGYRDGCFLKRDRYMVEHADLVFAYCTKKKGGTAYTVKYAERIGVPVQAFL